jgi:alpha-methylacyl-CoA racemase
MSFPPLYGIKIIEIAGLAPAPFCGLILSDFGADIIRVDRTQQMNSIDGLTRGKRSIAIDLKQKKGIEILLKLIEKVDVLIEPFRPGVAERLGFGPEIVLKLNPNIIYARLTGWGQYGAYATMAGHDINYISLAGSLSLFGRKDDSPPSFPVNILGDFAGGSLLCAFGIVMALFARNNHNLPSNLNKGQVIDSAMIDGCSYLNSFICTMINKGLWNLDRGTNQLDGGAHNYEVYKTKDGKYISVGALEPQFYQILLEKLGLKNLNNLPDVNDKDSWTKMKKIFSEIFIQKTRDEWCKIFDFTDSCVAPVLSLNEMENHLHTKDRQLYLKDKDGNIMPSPAPRFSNTPSKIHLQKDHKQLMPNLEPGQHTLSILKEYGFTLKEIYELATMGVIQGNGLKSSL